MDYDYLPKRNYYFEVDEFKKNLNWRSGRAACWGVEIPTVVFIT